MGHPLGEEISTSCLGQEYPKTLRDGLFSRHGRDIYYDPKPCFGHLISLNTIVGITVPNKFYPLTFWVSPKFQYQKMASDQVFKVAPGICTSQISPVRPKLFKT